MRVLVVDDELPVRRLFRHCLEATDMAVDEAPDIYQALSLVREHAYDVVVSDFLLPGGRANDLLDRLFTMPDAPPVVIVSGATSDGVERDLLARGARCVLHKPVTCDELCDAVEAAAKQQRPAFA